MDLICHLEPDQWGFPGGVDPSPGDPFSVGLQARYFLHDPATGLRVPPRSGPGFDPGYTLGADPAPTPEGARAECQRWVLRVESEAHDNLSLTFVWCY